MIKSGVLAAAFLVVACGMGIGVEGQAARFVAAQGSPYQIGFRPGDVAVADVNGDGAPDVAVAGDRTIGVLLGDGRGGFRSAPASPFTAGEPLHLIVTADFNADKRMDVAVTSHDSNAVNVLLGDSRGVFSVAPGSPFAAFTGVKPHNHGLAAGDLNGDGHPDLTLGHQDSGEIAVLVGDGRGGFTPGQGSPFAIGRGFYPHALGDLNADGNLDLVAPDIMGGAIVAALGNGRGALVAGSPHRVRERPYFVLLDDVNGDRRLDAIATHDDIDDVDVLLGDGRGGFGSAGGFRAGHRGWTIAAADLNADGRRDLLIGGMEGVRAFLGSADAGFTHSAEWSLRTPRATWKLAVADFNRDGKPDVVFPNVEEGSVSVMLQR